MHQGHSTRAGLVCSFPNSNHFSPPAMQRPQEAGQVAASVGELMDDAVRLGSYLDWSATSLKI